MEPVTEPMIELKNVSMSFQDRRILDDVSLQVQRGEILVVIGPSGSGKSTLLRLMIGLLKPDFGQIWVDGREISHLDEDELNRIRRNMGMVFQYSALFDSMTVGDNVAFGLREHTKYPEEKIQQIVREKLAMVGMEGVENSMPNELSGGMKKRVSLARAIAFSPGTIFYDEPNSGLDPIMSRKIDELITHTQQALKVTSVVVTHDMVSACHIADRIAMVYEGELLAVEPVAKFRKLKDPRIQAFLQSAYAAEGEEKE